MLIRHVPDAYEKLHILGGMAGDDILSPAADSGGPRVSRMPYLPREEPDSRRLQGRHAQWQVHQPDAE